MNLIVYATGLVGCAVVALPPGVEASAEVAAAIVPDEQAYVIVDSTTLPAGDPSTWALSDGKLSVSAAAQLSALQAQLVSAATATCNAITAAIVPDATHQNAYMLAYGMVGLSAAVPATDPAKTAFANMASANGFQPQPFAELVAGIAAAGMDLQGAYAALSAQAAAAKSVADLETALTGFESAITAIVSAITAAGVAVKISPAISIPGINA